MSCLTLLIQVKGTLAVGGVEVSGPAASAMDAESLSTRTRPMTPEVLSELIEQHLTTSMGHTKCEVLERDDSNIHFRLTMQLDYEEIYASDKSGFKRLLQGHLLKAVFGRHAESMPPNVAANLVLQFDIVNVERGSIILLIAVGLGIAALAGIAASAGAAFGVQWAINQQNQVVANVVPGQVANITNHYWICTLQ